MGIRPIRAQNNLLPEPATDILANSTEKVYRIRQSEVKITCDGSTPSRGVAACPFTDGEVEARIRLNRNQ